MFRSGSSSTPGVGGGGPRGLGLEEPDPTMLENTF
jgi:hypothetical protein